ncbi:MAG: amidase [Pseudomonadota bacterium]
MELTRQSATQLLSDLSARRLSAVELMSATLERIEQVNPGVNAIVALQDAESLMDQARARDHGPAQGPLHGLPLAIKDLVNVAGIASTKGSPLYEGYIPKVDDLLAARLRAAGAILIGKTNVPELGLGSHTFNPVYGTTCNPYDTARSCGGSSGGAAVALATGMVALADGTDMMGSLRNPAAWNNVYGFRPSWGRVPANPDGDGFLHRVSTPGPMARDPSDLAFLLDVMSVPSKKLPYGVDCPPVSPLTPAKLKDLRIGWLGDWGGAYAMEDGVLDLCESALAVLSDLGCTVDSMPPPFSSEAMWDSWTTLRSWSEASDNANLTDHLDRMKPTAQWEIERGLKLTAVQVHHASVARSQWFRCAAELFDSFDALVLPSAQVWPFATEETYPKMINGTAMDTYHRWMEVMVPVSLAGLPCLAAPVGFGSQGLPMGFQLFGPNGSDAKLLAVGAAYHEATRHPQSHPAF